MSTRAAISLAMAGVLLAGCVTQDPPQSSADPKSLTRDQSLVASVGIEAGTAQQKVDRQGLNNVVDAGVAASMASDYGAAGLGFGILGILASPGAGLEGSPHIILTLPTGASPATYEKRLSEAVFKAYGMQPEKQGYQRVSSTKSPNAIIYAKPGCGLTRWGNYKTNCSLMFAGNVYRPEGAKSGNTYMMNFSGPEIADYEAIAKRIVDQMPNELSLYLPPKKVGGTARPASLYRKGHMTPL